MPRPSNIDNDELIARLAGVFQDVGYEGASMALLSQASGLQRASLYHRFPSGKQQMAEEVLRAAIDWAVAHVIGPLAGEGDVRKRWATARRGLDLLYDGGRRSCLLHMLMAPRNADGPFAEAIEAALTALVDAFAQLARDAGAPRAEAARTAQRAVALIQGSLILARGLRNPKPFRDTLAALEGELIKTKTGDTP